MTRGVSVINNYAPPSAIYRYAFSLKRCLPGMVSVANICAHPSEFSGSWEDGVELGFSLRSRYLETAVNYLLWKWAFPRTWTKVLGAQLQGGVVHVGSPDVPPIFMKDQSVVTVHDNPLISLGTDLYSVPRSYKHIVRRNLRVYQQFKATIVQSDYVKKGLVDSGYNGNVTVIPPALHPAFRRLAISKTESRQSLGLPLDKRLVLSISTTAKRKNLSCVKQTMARLPPNYTLVRIGKSLGDSITFQGIDDEKLNRVYNSCDVLLFPSHEEGFGVPVPEAFAAGLPVVASAIPSIIEVSAGAALLLPADDSKALAKAIVDVTTSPDRAQ